MIFILKTMPSIRLLKKEINNDIGDFIEEIYLWELSNPNGDLAKSEKLIDEAIQTFDDLKSKFKAINQEHRKLMHSLLKKSAAL